MSLTPLEWFKTYNAIDADSAGHLVIDDILNYCAMDRTTARHRADGQIDPLAMAIMEGRRQVGLFIKGRMTEPKPQEEEVENG